MIGKNIKSSWQALIDTYQAHITARITITMSFNKALQRQQALARALCAHRRDLHGSPEMEKNADRVAAHMADFRRFPLGGGDYLPSRSGRRH